VSPYFPFLHDLGNSPSMGVLKSNPWNRQAPLGQKTRMHIKLARKYPGKFRKLPIQLIPTGQEISGPQQRRTDGLLLWRRLKKIAQRGDFPFSLHNIAFQRETKLLNELDI